MPKRTAAALDISSAVFGGEGLFQTEAKGSGIVVLNCPVPENELFVYELVAGEKLSIDGNFSLARTGSVSFAAEKSAKQAAEKAARQASEQAAKQAAEQAAKLAEERAARQAAERTDKQGVTENSPRESPPKNAEPSKKASIREKLHRYQQESRQQPKQTAKKKSMDRGR